MINSIKNKYKEISEPVKASVWYTIGNIINKGIALFLTPIFTRLLTTEEYGSFSIFQSWVSILIIFTSLNIFLGGYQKGLLLYKEDKDRFTSSQLALTSLITIIYFIIYSCNIEFFTNFFDLSPLLMYGMFLELFFMPAFEFWAAQQRFDYKYKKYVIITVAMSFLSLLLGVVLVVSSQNKLGARVYSDVLSKVLFYIPLFLLIFKKGKSFYNKNYWKYALAFNIPLIPHYLSNYVLGQSDRLMIGSMVGKSEAAFYSVAYTISTMILIIVNAINNSLTPFIYKSLENQQTHQIKNSTTPIVIMVGLLCIFTVIFAPEVIYLFAGKKYMDAIYVIPPVSISVFFVFLYSLYSNIEYYYQKTGMIAIATTISAVLNLILNYIFIKKCGYYAAGYTTLICYMFLACMHYIFYKRVSKKELKFNNVFDDKFIFVFSIIILLCTLFINLFYKTIMVRYLIAVVMIYILFRNRNIIFDYLKILRKK